MPYPVPPPEPPAIIYIAKPKKAALTVAASDGDTPSNSVETPEPSSEIVQPPQQPAQVEEAAVLDTAPATNQQPPEIAHPPATVESDEAVAGFGHPVAAEKPETPAAKQDSSFTAYQLGSVENAVAARNRQKIVGEQRKEDKNALKPQESWYRAQGRQLEENAPVPTEIPVPEPAPEQPPTEQQQFEIPTPGTAPAPRTSPKPATTEPKPKPKPAAPGVRTAPSQRTVPFPVSPADTIEIKADRQEFDDKQQIVTAVGNVVVRFRQTVIDADRAIVNLVTRQVVASGNVA